MKEEDQCVFLPLIVNLAKNDKISELKSILEYKEEQRVWLEFRKHLLGDPTSLLKRNL